MLHSLKRLLPDSTLYALPFSNMQHPFYLAVLGVREQSKSPWYKWKNPLWHQQVAQFNCEIPLLRLPDKILEPSFIHMFKKSQSLKNSLDFFLLLCFNVEDENRVHTHLPYYYCFTSFTFVVPLLIFPNPFNRSSVIYI